jgi:hypothetical protein
LYNVWLESSFSREGKEPDASFLKMSVAHVTNINFKVKSSREADMRPSSTAYWQP